MKSAICLIVRNEARDLAEWIAFHALAGFDTQLIFDNASDDGTDRVIEAAAGLHDIRAHHWPHAAKTSQTDAYDAAIAAYRLEFDWIAFIDSDEFFVTTNGEPVNTFLARYEPWSGIAVPWAIYGSSGHDAAPPGLIVEHFRARAGPDFFATRHVKSIVRPQFAGRCLNPHCFELRGHIAGSYCGPDGTPMAWWPAPEAGGVLPGLGLAPPDYTQCRVNHYFTRSRAHWRAKLRRGYPGDLAIRAMAEFDEYDRNEVTDPVASRGLRRLRAAAAAITARAGLRETG